MSWGPDHKGMQSSEGVRVGETGTEGVCWGPEDTAHPRNQGGGEEESHRDWRKRPGPRLRARGFLRCAQVKGFGSSMWSRAPAHSDHWEERAQAEALGGSGTRTELFALLHLPPRVVGTHVHAPPSCLPEILFYIAEPRSRLSQKLCRPLHTEVGEAGGLWNSREPWRARGKQVTGSTVTWRGRKVHGVRRQGVWLYPNKEQV